MPTAKQQRTHNTPAPPQGLEFNGSFKPTGQYYLKQYQQATRTTHRVSIVLFASTIWATVIYFTFGEHIARAPGIFNAVILFGLLPLNGLLTTIAYLANRARKQFATLARAKNTVIINSRSIKPLAIILSLLFWTHWILLLLAYTSQFFIFLYKL